MQMTSLRKRPRLPSYFPNIFSMFPIHVSWDPGQSYLVKMAPYKLELVGQRAYLSCGTVAICLLLVAPCGTVIPVSLIAVVPTVLEKSMFCGHLAVASVSLRLLIQFVHCCLVTARAFMPASLIGPIVKRGIDCGMDSFRRLTGSESML